MAKRSKVFADFASAVADIPDGASIAFGGFAYPGVPFNLIAALLKQGAKNLTCVTNATGGAAPDRMPDVGMLVQNNQVSKVVASFTAPTRASDRIPLTQYVAEGKVVAELVPQGTLAERLRAAGCGIPAFYTPTAVGTELAAGRETRVFGGREYLLEEALPVDVAFIRAWKADTAGNLLFRRSQRNFNPLMAMAAKLTIVEVEEDFLEPGAIDPDEVHTASIFVHRMVRIPPAPEGLWPGRRPERAAPAKEKQS